MTPPGSRWRTALDWYAPTGRIRRGHWWLRYVLPFVLVGALAAQVDRWALPESVTLRVADEDADLFWFLPDRGGPVLGATAVLLLVPYVAAVVTRLHDRDHSAWWLLWLFLGPVGVVVLAVTGGLLGTQPYANRYGPPPR